MNRIGIKHPLTRFLISVLLILLSAGAYSVFTAVSFGYHLGGHFVYWLLAIFCSLIIYFFRKLVLKSAAPTLSLIIPSIIALVFYYYMTIILPVQTRNAIEDVCLLLQDDPEFQSVACPDDNNVQTITSNDAVTNPIIVRGPRSNQSNEELFLEIELNKETVYVQEQLLFTIRLYYTINGIRNPQFTELEVPDTVIQLIGSPNQYEELIESVRFGVYEKRYVIFPQRSGPLEIPDILFRGEVTVTDGSSNFVFRNPNMRRVTALTEGITINVDERPSSGYQAAVNAGRLVTRNEIVYEINSNIPFTGISSIYYLNGQVEERTTFKDGKRDGIFEKYSENGILSSRVYYKMDGGRLMTCLLSDSVTVTNASSDCSDLN